MLTQRRADSAERRSEKDSGNTEYCATLRFTDFWTDLKCKYKSYFNCRRVLQGVLVYLPPPPVSVSVCPYVHLSVCLCQTLYISAAAASVTIHYYYHRHYRYFVPSLSFFSAELSRQRYWRGPTLQELVEGELMANATVTPTE